ncbi:hypothetical protein T492DRAFT_840340 [Pavlovales sp. CCMP2436]|nr:hypothetical protein T492DRAFT_840340 [Pavlovales sp. CCMP2436]
MSRVDWHLLCLQVRRTRRDMVCNGRRENVCPDRAPARPYSTPSEPALPIAPPRYALAAYGASRVRAQDDAIEQQATDACAGASEDSNASRDATAAVNSASAAALTTSVAAAASMRFTMSSAATYLASRTKSVESRIIRANNACPDREKKHFLPFISKLHREIEGGILSGHATDTVMACYYVARRPKGSAISLKLVGSCP